MDRMLLVCRLGTGHRLQRIEFDHGSYMGLGLRKLLNDDTCNVGVEDFVVLVLDRSQAVDTRHAREEHWSGRMVGTGGLAGQRSTLAAPLAMILQRGHSAGYHAAGRRVW